MADNLTVLNSTGGTFTLRMKDVGAGVLANMSVPTDTVGNTFSVLAGSAVTSTAQGAMVVVVSSLSPTHLVSISSATSVTPSSAVQVTLTSATFTLSSAATVTPSSAPTVALSTSVTNLVAITSGTVTTTISSGVFAIANGANTAAVKAAATAPSSNDPALVVAISPNGVNANGQNTAVNSAPVVIASDNATLSVILTSTGTNTVAISSAANTVAVSSLSYINIANATLTVTPSSIINVVNTPSSALTVSPLALTGATTGGLTLYSIIASTTTNSNLVSSSPRGLYKVEAFNNTTTVAFLKMYNLSSAPTAGSGTPAARYMVPANSGFISTTDIGDAYGTGLAFTMTGGAADADTTVLTSSIGYLVNIHYK